MNVKRTFIAIKVEPQKTLLEFFRSLKHELRFENIKWVEEPNLHITLQFLGETTQEQILKVDSVLKMLAADNNFFTFDLAGTGYFGSKNQPKVLYARVTDNNWLSEFVTKLLTQTTGFGFEDDKKTFSPHLTLGRIKQLDNSERFHKLLLPYKNEYFQKNVVSEVIFYESILYPSGPVYQPIEIYRLNKPI